MCPASLCDWLGVQREDAMGDRDVDWLDQLCEADEKIAELESENAKLREQLRWRDAYGESPTEEGIYLVINNDFDGCTSIHATYWKGKWPIGFTVPYWRPIGPLPGEGGE